MHLKPLKQIWLCRHGDNVRDGAAEEDVPLSELGQAQMHKAGVFMAQNHIQEPVIIVSSGVLRSDESAKCIKAGLLSAGFNKAGVFTLSSELLVNGQLEAQLELFQRITALDQMQPSPSSTVLIGHRRTNVMEMWRFILAGRGDLNKLLAEEGLTAEDLADNSAVIDRICDKAAHVESINTFNIAEVCGYMLQIKRWADFDLMHTNVELIADIK
ncbi:MAG: histidine phosphatase family protein [Alphaproteobacteria bacterium]